MTLRTAWLNQQRTGSSYKRVPSGRRALQALWHEHNGKCWLCGECVDFPHDHEDRESIRAKHWIASVDHVLPRSQGGIRPGNIRLAHRWCNSFRGTREVTEELKQEIRAERTAKIRRVRAHRKSQKGLVRDPIEDILTRAWELAIDQEFPGAIDQLCQVIRELQVKDRKQQCQLEELQIAVNDLRQAAKQ